MEKGVNSAWAKTGPRLQHTGSAQQPKMARGTDAACTTCGWVVTMSTTTVVVRPAAARRWLRGGLAERKNCGVGAH
jgi:hypothetical protein